MSKILIEVSTVRLALEALESCDAAHITDGGHQWYDEKLVDKAITALKALASKAKEHPALAHCAAGPEYCQQCHKEAFEDRSLALAAAVRYVKNNTPNLVWAEINRALATPQAQPAPAITPEHLLALAKTASLELDKVIKAFQMAAPGQQGQTCNCRWEDEVQVQQCTLHEAHVDAIHEWAGRAKAAEAKLKEQSAQQEPVFCEHCGGNDEDPQDHCMDCTRPRWVPVTQELLNNQHPWLYEPMWLATKGGTVLQGYYEWRQGWNPDRFVADGFDHWAFDFAYVMPIVKPAPPDKEKA